MIKNKIKVEGRLIAKKNDKIIYDSKNLLLDTGIEYVLKLLAGDNIDTETSYGLESIAIGDSNAVETEEQEDLQGSEIDEEQITFNIVNNQLYLSAEFTNNSGSTITHTEFVLTNNYDAGIGNRTCLSRIVLDKPIELEDEEYIEYVWLIEISR